MNKRIAAIGLVLLAIVAGAVWLFLQPEETSSAAAPPSATPPVEATPHQNGEVTLPTRESTPNVEPDREAAAAAASSAPTPDHRPLGAVRVRVVDDETGKAIPGVEVTLVPMARGALCFHSVARSDAEGVAHFDSIEAGPVAAVGDRSGQVFGQARADAITELELTMEGGCTVEGRVVNGSGGAVSQPEVWLFQSGRFLHIADCDSTGGFRIEHVAPGSSLAGIARDATSSKMFDVVGEPGATVHAELVVDQPTTILLGQVLDDAERPIADAAVGVDSQVAGSGMFGMSNYMTTHTDGEGRFLLPGATGNRVLIVRAPNFAPYTAQVECAPGQRVEHIARLKPGAIVIGRVTFDDGTVVANATIEVGDMLDEMLGSIGVSDELGEYRIAGLPPGTVTIRARAENGDDAQQDLELAAGRATVWNPVVPRPEGDPATSGKK
jgi:hypothetical protein